MKINEIPADPGKRQKTKRRGRGEGSGLGKSAGKGNKGQKARSGGAKGGTFEGGQMPLARRLPKRGFTNPFKRTYEVVNISTLSSSFQPGEIVEPETLYKHRIVRKKSALIKILGDGEIDKSLTVKAHKFSKSAFEKITAKGGSCEEIK